MSESLCRRCGIRAAVTVLEVHFSGSRQDWQVCGPCLAELLGSGSVSGNEPEGTGVCPSCGFTSTEFRKTKKLGCPECYSAFSSLLDRWRQNEGYPTGYAGPLPPSLSGANDSKKEVEDLKTALEVAVREERYEDAALLRDQLRQKSPGTELDS